MARAGSKQESKIRTTDGYRDGCTHAGKRKVSKRASLSLSGTGLIADAVGSTGRVLRNQRRQGFAPEFTAAGECRPLPQPRHLSCDIRTRHDTLRRSPGGYAHAAPMRCRLVALREVSRERYAGEGHLQAGGLSHRRPGNARIAATPGARSVGSMENE